MFDPQKKEDPTFFNPYKYSVDGGSIIEAESVIGNHFKTYGDDHPAAIAGVSDLDAYYFYVFEINWELLKIESQVLPETISIELSTNRDAAGKFTITFESADDPNLLGRLKLIRSRSGFETETIDLRSTVGYSKVILALMINARLLNRPVYRKLSELNITLKDYGVSPIKDYQEDSFRKAIVALARNRSTPEKLSKILPMVFTADQSSVRIETSISFSENFPRISETH